MKSVQKHDHICLALKQEVGGVTTNVFVDIEVEETDAAVELVIQKAVQTALQHLDADEAEVSVVLCDDAQIQELNRQWRDVDAPTDVLSFPLEEMDDTEPGRELAPDEPRLLGDIVISLPRAKEQATEYGHSLDRELAFLAVHGVLHLLGYDHEDENEQVEMRAREEEILSTLGLER